MPEVVGKAQYEIPNVPVAMGLSALFHSTTVPSAVKAEFNTIMKLNFDEIFSKAITSFPVVEDSEAALFTAIALRVLLFGDPNLQKKHLERTVYFQGHTIYVTDVGTMLLEALSVSALMNHTIESAFAQPASSELAKQMKRFAVSSYVVLYFDEIRKIETPTEPWQSVVLGILEDEPEALCTLEDYQTMVFELAKTITSAEHLAKINVEACIEQLEELYTGTGNFIAASAKSAMQFTDGENIYSLDDLSPEDHEHEEYARPGDAVYNALRLVDAAGNLWGLKDFARKNHEHPEYARPDEVKDANYLVTSTGERLSADDLAFASHHHPDYLVKTEPAFAAKNFTDGVRIYTADDFAPRGHGTNPEYLNKNPKHRYLLRTETAVNTRALQGYPLSSFALADHTHPEFITYAEADQRYRLSTESIEEVEVAKGFVIHWY